MEAVWLVFVTIVVFLIVFFVAWGLRVRPLTAVALACIWTLVIQAIMIPNSFASFQGCGMTGWWGAFWVLAAAFTIYLIFYVTYMATKDHEPRKNMEIEVTELSF